MLSRERVLSMERNYEIINDFDVIKTENKRFQKI